MSSKDSENPVEFRPEDVLQQGVEFGDRSDPVDSHRDTIHGKAVYLKSKVLSHEHMAKLLSKGRANVVVLRVASAHTKNGVKRLISEVTRLRKLLGKPRTEE